MQKTKIDFIVDLLADKRMETSLKERAFELVSKQIGNIETESLLQLKEVRNKIENVLDIVIKNNDGINEIKVQIEGLKNNNRFNSLKTPPQVNTSKQPTTRLYKPIVNTESKGNNIEKKTTPKIHKPRETYRLLAKFESSEGLKFLTHLFDKPDEKFNREKIVQIAYNEFKEFDNGNIDNRLRNRIRAFAFNANPEWFTWYDGKRFESKLGWSSKEFIDWCENPLNEDSDPVEFTTFKEQMIIPFKQSIQVRKEQLPVIIERAINKGLGNSTKNIVFDQSLNGTTFFTNVEMFESGLRYIFSAMKLYISDNSKIAISTQQNLVINNFRFRVLKIIHIGSLLNSNSSEEIIGGDLLEAKDRFTGLCNWSIQAKFDDGYFEKRILKDTEIPEIESIESVEGFTHLLYFYA
jgi:hypothetical protein